MASINLDSLIAGLSLAIHQAQTALDKQVAAQYLSYFETLPPVPPALGEPAAQPAIRPRMVTLPIPLGPGHYQNREIPMVALVQHQSLALEEVHLKLWLGTSTNTKDGQLLVELGTPDKDGEGRSNVGAIELHFKRQDRPEGMSRVTAEFIKRI